MLPGLLLLLAAERPRSPAQEPPRDPQAAIDLARVRDPWVFRCVLDGRPRMLVAALSDEMWVAYDTQTCNLDKAWKGGVTLDGAVYTTVHGPAPTSVGPSYTEGLAGDVWRARIADKDAAVRVAWKGFRFNAGHVVLHYDAWLADGRHVEVQEAPESVQSDKLFDEARRAELGVAAGKPGLLRSFFLPDPPPDVTLTLTIRTDGATAKLAEHSELAGLVEVQGPDGAKVLVATARVLLSAATPSNNVILFFEPRAVPPPAAGGGK